MFYSGVPSSLVVLCLTRSQTPKMEFLCHLALVGPLPVP